MESKKFPEVSGGFALLDVQFEYPKGWKIEQDKGKTDPYSQVLILGPRNAAGTFTNSFVVRKSAPHGWIKNAEDMKKNELNRFFLDKALVREGSLKVGGVEAKEAVVTYTNPMTMAEDGPKAVATPMQSRIVVFERGGQIYEVLYDADRGEYSRYEKQFDRLLRTFRFTS